MEATQAEIEQQLAENQRRIDQIQAEQDRREYLRPMRLLNPLAQAAMREEEIDWPEAVKTLEAALAVAYAEAAR
jgi:hypothetical protein